MNKVVYSALMALFLVPSTFGLVVFKPFQDTNAKLDKIIQMLEEAKDAHKRLESEHAQAAQAHEVLKAGHEEAAQAHKALEGEHAEAAKAHEDLLREHMA